MKPRLLIIGAGGHARVVITLARLANTWEISGVLDRARLNTPELIDGIPVIGTFEDAETLFASGHHHAALAVGDNEERARLFARLSRLGFTFPLLRHPTSIIETNVVLGKGCTICAGAILGTQVVLGDNVIINTGAILDHETVVGDHAHIAPGCRVAGRVKIGAGTMLGIGSCVREKQTIGTRAVIGAGSVIVDDIPDAVVAYGNPARVIRPHTP